MVPEVFLFLFLLILWDIPLRRSCHVQTEIVLFLPPHAFPFPFLCYCNGQNFHSQVEEERWQGKSVPSLWSEGKEFTFSPLSIILAVGFLKYFLNQVGIPVFWVFIMSGCWILSNAVYLIDIIIWFFCFFFLPVDIIDYITWFSMLNLSCNPGINPAWLCYIIHSIPCWILFSNVLLRIFASMFMRYIDT